MTDIEETELATYGKCTKTRRVLCGVIEHFSLDRFLF